MVSALFPGDLTDMEVLCGVGVGRGVDVGCRVGVGCGVAVRSRIGVGVGVGSFHWSVEAGTVGTVLLVGAGFGVGIAGDRGMAVGCLADSVWDVWTVGAGIITVAVIGALVGSMIGNGVRFGVGWGVGLVSELAAGSASDGAYG